MSEGLKRAFVTGANGFIGIHLCKKLVEENWHVTALARSKTDLEYLPKKNLDIVHGSIEDLNSFTGFVDEGIDAVFHLAGVTSQWSRDFKRQTNANVNGTKNVLDAASEKDVKRFIHVSSIMAFGLHKDVIDETTVSNASSINNNYSLSKWKAENLVLNASKSGMDVVIINPSHVVGPIDRKSHIQLFQAIINDALPGITPGKGMFCHVEDVASALLAAYNKGENGEKYLIGGHHLSFKELASEIRGQLGKNKNMAVIPEWVFKLSLPFYTIGSWITGKEPLLTKGKVQISCKNIQCNDQKGRNRFGLTYKSPQEMVSDTLAWIDSEKQK